MHNRSAYFWTLAVSIINSLEAVVILMVAMRSVGAFESGVITIGFSLANLYTTVGRFSVRTFQVTDIKNEYERIDYIKLRLITFLIMCVCFGCYVLYQFCIFAYSANKVFIICGIFMLHASEVAEDVFSAEYQKIERLDISSFIAFIRWFFSILTVVFFLIIFRNAVIAVWSGAITSWLIMGIAVHLCNNKLGIKIIYNKNLHVRSLFMKCLPICISSFLTYYVVNAAKYSIDRYMGDDIQAYYGFVSMPVYAITMICNVVYQPQLVQYATLYSENRNKELKRKIVIQILFVVGLTLAGTIATFFCGIPILNYIYHVDLSNYKFEMLVVMLSGGFVAISSFWGYIYTILRMQNRMMYINITMLVFAIMLMPNAVVKYGTHGASVVHLFLVILMSVLYLYVFGLMKQSEKV